MTTIGLLHPGEMGARSARRRAPVGRRVLWASEGRSTDTWARAAAAELDDAGTVAALAAASDVVLSVCPPHGALDIAREVAAAGFRGLYVDGNADRAGHRADDRRHRARRPAPPTWTAASSARRPTSPAPRGSTSRAPAAERDRGALRAGAAGGGRADRRPHGGLGHQDGVRGVDEGLPGADHERARAGRRRGVDEALLAEWVRSQPDLPKRSENAARGTARKAWRWVGEMDEIAATFAAAGLPDGFHRGASELYRRMAVYKDAATPPSIDDVAKTLLKEPGA